MKVYLQSGTIVSGHVRLPSNQNETRSNLATSVSEGLRSPIVINTITPSVTCLLTSSILISSQEVQLTHEDLIKIPSQIIVYLQGLEDHLRRESNTNILGKEQRMLCQEKSRLLSEVRSDIVMKILDIAQCGSRKGALDQDDDDASS